MYTHAVVVVEVVVLVTMVMFSLVVVVSFGMNPLTSFRTSH